jgi:endonuclease/exonuclease/phosphatase family metal-dependent hydrolase
MSFKVASWNVAGGLDDNQTAPVLVEGIKRIDADVFVICEACGDDEIASQAEDFAKELGYTAILNVPYEDKEPRDGLFKNNSSIMAMSRLPETRMDMTRLAVRNAIIMEIPDPDNHTIVKGIGTHLDDRREDLRNTMAGSIINQISPDSPMFVIGDLNAMHGHDLRAKLLHSNIARWAAKNLTPTTRLESLATRLNAMANGETLRLLGRAGLIDADSKHQPTMKMARIIPLVQLDHLLFNEHLLVKDFDTHPISGSDHKAISATLSVI